MQLIRASRCLPRWFSRLFSSRHSGGPGSTARNRTPHVTEIPLGRPDTSPPYNRFTDRARKVMQLANQEAQHLNHEYIGTEHILLGLIKEGSGVAANVLKNLGVDLRTIRLEVERIIQKGLTPSSWASCRRRRGQRQSSNIRWTRPEASTTITWAPSTYFLDSCERTKAWQPQILMNLGLRLEKVPRRSPKHLGATSRGAKETVREWIDAQRKAKEQSRVQCNVETCNLRATFHLTYAERRKCVRERHLCEKHAKEVLLPFKANRTVGSGTPAVAGARRHFDIDLIIVTEISDQQVILLREVAAAASFNPHRHVRGVCYDAKLIGDSSPWPSERTTQWPRSSRMWR